jgi:hypothetical protein
VCNVSFIVCVALCSVLIERGVLFCVIYVLLCAVSLPPGKTPFAVQFNNNKSRKPDCLCGLVIRVLGYRCGGPCSIPGTTKKKSSGSGTGSTQPREYN